MRIAPLVLTAFALVASGCDLPSEGKNGDKTNTPKPTIGSFDFIPPGYVAAKDVVANRTLEFHAQREDDGDPSCYVGYHLEWELWRDGELIQLLSDVSELTFKVKARDFVAPAKTPTTILGIPYDAKNAPLPAAYVGKEYKLTLKIWPFAKLTVPEPIWQVSYKLLIQDGVVVDPATRTVSLAPVSPATTATKPTVTAPSTPASKPAPAPAKPAKPTTVKPAKPTKPGLAGALGGAGP